MQQTGSPIVLISDGTKAESELIIHQVERNCRRMWARNARAWLQEGRGGTSTRSRPGDEIDKNDPCLKVQHKMNLV
jgi:hypothetical protein